MRAAIAATQFAEKLVTTGLNAFRARRSHHSSDRSKLPPSGVPLTPRATLHAQCKPLLGKSNGQPSGSKTLVGLL
jgi:hypothetical protein